MEDRVGTRWDWAAELLKTSDWGDDFVVVTGTYNKRVGYVFVDRNGMSIIVDNDGNVMLGEPGEKPQDTKTEKEEQPMGKVAESITFKGRKYQFENTIPTLISKDYVPDWNLEKAVTESVQNMMDEVTETGCTKDWYLGDTEINFRDGGRGVDLEQIFIIGDSGKRGKEDLVGQHGEGEVVSFMVAARLGVRKMMASQDWLAVGRLEDLSGRDVLHIDAYRTKSPRKGTAWQYIGPGVKVAMEISLDRFRVKINQQKEQERADAHRAKRYEKAHRDKVNRRKSKGLLTREPAGYIYTRGLYVCSIEGLEFAYNLTATPGRDRSVFSWENIKGEVATILAREAKAKDIERLLRAAKYNGATRILEFSLLDVEFDVKMVQRAVRRATGSRSLRKMAWGNYSTDASTITDATGQGATVLGFEHGKAPKWVKDSIHHVQQVAGVMKRGAEKPLPKALEDAVDEACYLLLGTPMAKVGVEWRAVLKDMDDKGTQAYATLGKVILVRTAVKGMGASDFLGTIAHELGHALGGYEDCTRGHANYIAEKMGHAVDRAVMEPKRWKHLVAVLKAYSK